VTVKLRLRKSNAVTTVTTVTVAALLAIGVSATTKSDAAYPSRMVATGGSSPALELAAIDRKLAAIDGQEKAAKKDLAEVAPKAEALHARVVTRGRDFYKLSRAGMLPVGGGFDELVRHAMNVERSRRALESDLEDERRGHEHGAELARALERITEERASLMAERSKLDGARLAMDDENRRSEAFSRAFRARVARGVGSVGGGGSDFNSTGFGVSGGGGVSVSRSDESYSGSGFAQQKGRLLFPVSGKADVRPARREGTDGPGLEILAPVGSPVRATYAGRVAFADKYGPYGRLVILDHGDHYYTVSGNLAAIDVRVGDEVSAGDRLGTVGDDGQGAMLYFEVRRGTDTIAPNGWLGL
jgi:septal ring factor EnvC (AmiA/AmiB activator)